MADLMATIWRHLPEIITKGWLVLLMAGAFYFGMIIIGAAVSGRVWNRLFGGTEDLKYGKKQNHSRRH